MAWDDVLVAHVSKYTAAIHNEMVNQIKARILHSLDTEANGILVGTGAGAFIFKTLAQFKTILGLGDAAYKNTGSSTGTLCAGDDSRLSNPRDPNAHKSTHATAGMDALSAGDIGAVATADIDTDSTFAANSDSKVPSQKAVKTAIEIRNPRRGFTKISRGYNASGAEVTIRSDNPSYEYIASGYNGDYAIFDIFAFGGETHLDITYRKESSFGIFNLYINSVLDSSGYDLYGGSSSGGVFAITLKQPMVAGWNEIKLVVNGKNASSSGYLIGIIGMRARS